MRPWWGAVALATAVATGHPAAARAAARPQVLKVEPPGWWPGHSVNPVRLMVRGRGLEGATLEPAPGLRVDAVKVNGAGTYLFADVHLDAAAAPGRRTLRVRTPGGAAEAAFEVLAPLPREGRFQGFGPDDVLYLIMPDRFANGTPANDDPAKAPGLLDRGKGRYYHGGDLQGVIDRLPYLKDLGVTALWMTPWYDNVDRLNEKERYDGLPITDYHGYGATDFYAVDEHLGDLPKLRELVEAAHRQGLKVIQDQVANHTGPYHPWVQDSPTPTWYNGTAERHLRNTWQTWTLADPWAVPDLQRETLQGWFIDILPDLNQDDPETARYIVQNALWWVGMTGLDGIRQDTLPYVPRRFWAEWRAALRREYPRLSVVGELFDGDPALVSFFQGGAFRFDGIDTGFESLFDFPLYYPVRRAFAEGKPLRELAMAVARDHLYRDPSALVTFAGLHDVGRFLGEPGATADGLKLAYTFLFTTRGIPLVYYGDEAALRGGGDPDNRRDFPGGFPGDPRSAFEDAGRTPEQQAVFEHVRRLAGLRREVPALRRGRLVHLLAGEQTYAYARVGEAGAALVVLNNGTEPAQVDVAVGPTGWRDGAEAEDRLSPGPPRVTVAEGRVRLTLPPRSGAVYTLR
jgi:glycosidase